MFAARVGSAEIDIFPACRAILERDMPTYDPESIGILSAAQRLTVDPEDPERPILFEAPRNHQSTQVLSRCRCFKKS